MPSRPSHRPPRQLPGPLHAAAAVWATVAALGPARLQAQTTYRVTSEPTCAACSIHLVPVVTISGRGWEGLVGYPVALDRLSSGEWLLVPAENIHQISVFDSAGRFLRYVGRRGRGPGEYGWITNLVVDSGDTIRVYDAAVGRLTTLDPSFEYVRADRLDIKSPTDLIPAGRDSFVVAAEIARTGSLGYPLHLIDAEGEVIRSFGAVDPEYHGDRPRRMIRAMARAGPGQIWSAPLMRYVIERWSVVGDRVADYIRQADEDWKSGIGTVSGAPGRPAHKGIVDREAFYDTILEVIDPRTAQLIAHRRFPQYLVRFHGDQVVGYREDEEGYPTVGVWRVRLEHER